jgi:CubicO group peptidase (beta-lactamase class C family)
MRGATVGAGTEARVTMKRMGAVGAMVAIILGVGCAREAPPRVPGAHVSAAAPAGAPFVPGKADAARRARLDGVAPELDAFFASKFRESGATGFAVGVILEGELAYERYFGVREVGKPAAVDGDTVFRIASMTKSFTALAVLKLRDEGKLALDDPAEKYLPELAALRPPTRDSPPVSVRLLLTNASGLGYDDLWGTVTFGRDDEGLAALLKSGVAFSTSPGTRYEYSNLGWALLGKLVERVSKRPYREYVTEHVLLPLGMTSTVWESDQVAPGRLATGYFRAGEQLSVEPRPPDGVFAAGGGLYSSLRDYARYAAYQLSAYPPRDDAEVGPVRRSTLREMHEGQRWVHGDKDAPVAKMTDEGIYLGTASYGMGWLNVTSCKEEGRVQHGGYEPGYFGWVVLMPQARVAYVALATSGAAGIASRFGVFDILRKGGVLDAPAPTPDPALAAAAAAIPQLLAAWDPALFARTFDPDSLRYAWNARWREDFARLTLEHGRCRPEGGLRAYRPLHGELRLACDRGALVFDLLVAPAEQRRLQHAGLVEELMPDELTTRAAGLLAGAVAGGVESLGPNLLDGRIDPAWARKRFRALAVSHGSCRVARAWREVVHEPFSVERTSRATLACSDGPLELAFGVDASSGKVTALKTYLPRTPDALCWQ